MGRHEDIDLDELAHLMGEACASLVAPDGELCVGEIRLVGGYPPRRPSVPRPRGPIRLRLRRSAFASPTAPDPDERSVGDSPS